MGAQPGMVSRQGSWLTARIGDELVMMSPERSEYVGLSDVGARIWELLEEPRSPGEICDRLRQEFDVSAETCRAEVDDFLSELAKHGAVVLDSKRRA
ncbi:MAG: PqqD family protein [Caulobacteraceae bacterium]